MDGIEDKIEKIAGKRSRKAVKDWLEKQGNVKTKDFGWVKKKRLDELLACKHMVKSGDDLLIATRDIQGVVKYLHGVTATYQDKKKAVSRDKLFEGM